MPFQHAAAPWPAHAPSVLSPSAPSVHHTRSAPPTEADERERDEEGDGEGVILGYHAGLILFKMCSCKSIIGQL